jgi:hypothetical protein
MKEMTLILLLISSISLCHAQDDQTKNNKQSKPALSGIWELDKSRSKLTKENPVMRGGTITLTILHGEPEVRITQKTNTEGNEKTKEFLYYTDNRGEINPASDLFLSFHNGMKNPYSDNPGKIESKSKWKGDKLKTSYSIIMPIPGGRRTVVKVEEEWALSSDGRTLTQTSSFSGGRDVNLIIQIEPRRLKRVYKRVS